MRERNLEVTCGTCPYWEFRGGKFSETNRGAPGSMGWSPGPNYGQCYRNPKDVAKSRGDVCGEHPDFFLEATDDTDN